MRLMKINSRILAVAGLAASFSASAMAEDIAAPMCRTYINGLGVNFISMQRNQVPIETAQSTIRNLDSNNPNLRIFLINLLRSAYNNPDATEQAIQDGRALKACLNQLNGVDGSQAPSQGREVQNQQDTPVKKAVGNFLLEKATSEKIDWLKSFTEKKWQFFQGSSCGLNRMYFSNDGLVVVQGGKEISMGYSIESVDAKNKTFSFKIVNTIGNTSVGNSLPQFADQPASIMTYTISMVNDYKVKLARKTQTVDLQALLNGGTYNMGPAKAYNGVVFDCE